MPTFNHAALAPQVLAKLDDLALPVIAVDDGSTDATAAVLATWSAQSGRAGRSVVRHAANRGKAAALRSGFEEAMRLGYTHAVTIDSDGQHDPAEIAALLAISRAEPGALVLGERTPGAQTPGDSTAGTPATPWLSMVGRRTVNAGVYSACGRRLSDSQCGLRVYPLELVRRVPCRAGRYAFESEIITRAAWAGWPLRTTPIHERYAPRGRRASHFRLLRDTFQGLWLQARLQARSLLPWPHVHTGPGAGEPLSMIESAERVETPDTAETPHDARASETRWALFTRSLLPATLIADARRDDLGRTLIAASLSIGVFVAMLPIYPLHVPAAIWLALMLRLQPLALIAAALLAFTPATSLVTQGAIVLGDLVIPGSAADVTAGDLAGWRGTIEVWTRQLPRWALGFLLIGPALMLTIFAIASALLSRWPRTHSRTGFQPVE